MRAFGRWRRRSSDGFGSAVSGDGIRARMMGAAHASTAIWRVWIDTGGTFTDCVAIDPEGTEHRLKILSTSAFRGTVEEKLSDRRLRVTLPFDLPDDFLSGSILRRLGERDGVLIEASSGDGVLRLGGRSRLERGSLCEIQTADEAPVLAARVVTGTPAGRALPEMSMRLATTRATNALLERSGAATALFITHGLGDLLEIGTQQRPDLPERHGQRAHRKGDVPQMDA